VLLTLKQTIIYGPIKSRRLGNSLGINLLPQKQKICTFNCRYCHYGWTKYLIHDLSQFEKELPSPEEVKKALEEYLGKDRNIDYITFSGNGEPSSHPEFAEIVDLVIKTKDEFVPGKKVAILSNSTMLDQKRVRDALEKLDLRIMKFDCGNENSFKKFNRPYKAIKFEEIFKNLKSLKEIVIQTLLAGGENGNFSEKDVKDWKEKIAEIKPLYVQLYSLDREPADSSLRKIEKEKLIEIKNDLEKNHKIKVEIF
jgi:wyosine [tRNA(Phe)-imidazoG37] synthetase (radical SAM superfamily)